MWLLKAGGGGLLGLVLCMAVPMAAWSSDKEAYDGPDVQQPGRTIHGKVIKSVERDRAAQQWDVSVENVRTGEVVQVHLDKTTERKEQAAEPSPGDLVVVKYDENSKHALTFAKDIPKAQ